MIYLQMWILILEIGLCYLINNVLKDTLNKKYDTPFVSHYYWIIGICVRIVHTLFCLLVLLALFKKRKPIICILLSAIISTSIVTFGSMNMYTIHQTTYNITTTKEITNTKFLSTWQRLREWIHIQRWYGNPI